MAMFARPTKRPDQGEKDVAPLTPAEYARTFIKLPTTTDTGVGPFSFAGRRYMIQVYETAAELLVLCCGRQTTKSTLLGNQTLAYSTTLKNYMSLYVAPSEQQAKMFSIDRLKKPIMLSPYLQAFHPSSMIGDVFHKMFTTGSEIRLRYAFHNADRTRGIQTHQLTIDELQDFAGEHIPVIEQTLFTAKPGLKRRRYAGTPKTVDNVLSGFYYESSQNEWLVPCRRHKFIVWNIAGEENLPLGNPSLGLVCKQCKKSIDPMDSLAHWASMRPEAKELDGEGYCIPQLIAPDVDWHKMVHDYHKYPRYRWMNECAGRPYDSSAKPITKDQIMAWCDSNASITRSSEFARNLPWALSGTAHGTFMGVDHGCHSEDTRTLTDKGFKYWWEISDDDLVAQYEPDTKAITMVKPLKKIVFDYEGDMIHFKNKSQDILVTPDHRMLVRKGPKGKMRVHEASELEGLNNLRFQRTGEWEGEAQETFTLPAVVVANGWREDSLELERQFPMSDWLELLGWLLSDSGVCKNKEGRPTEIRISQSESAKPQYVAEIRALVARLGLNVVERRPSDGYVQFRIYGKQVWKWVADNIGVFAQERRIPRQFLSLPREQLRLLLHTMMKGDGGWDPRYVDNGVYYTTSPGLADDVLELALKAGYCAIKGDAPLSEWGKLPKYRVCLSPAREAVLGAQNENIVRVPYKGKAYCFRVPSGFFVTERNGRVAVQGNSGENSFTYVVILSYMGGYDQLRVIYFERFTGELTEPPNMLAHLKHLASVFRVMFIGADYGGGYQTNDALLREFGALKVHRYQYAAVKSKIEWNDELGYYQIARTEVMTDILEAVKRGCFTFPRWEEMEMDGGLGREMCNLTSEIRKKEGGSVEQLYFSKPRRLTDDGMHALTYATLASTLFRPRPDIFLPGITSNKDVYEDGSLDTTDSPGHRYDINTEDYD